MTTNRRAAILVGILYILGTVFGILSGALTSSIFSDNSYLVKIFQNQTQVRLSAMAVLCMGISLAFLAIIMYPILKETNRTLALIYLVFRSGIETITYIITAISFLLLITLSVFSNSVIGNSIDISLTGGLLKSISGFPITVFIFSIDAFILYVLFFENRLIPRWISIFGLIAIILHFLTGVLVLFDIQNSESTVNTIMNLPIFLQEMIMAVWLIVKGFSSKAVESK
jgi:hypothetical protein